ncbi:hypothetical protein [Euzebyella saccharophila]|uniref:Uncharacterized protein n=1 Tax=Euzebyella saccharophila TaxID=679664 RepID=A0ABV8JQF0_9FLAO|nr:hypothetical protein [Euzebyella saccharophila]
MKNEYLEIYHHDSDRTVTHKLNSLELRGWITTLKYVQKEIGSLVDICSNEIRSKLKDSDLFVKFDKKKEENARILEILTRYSHSRSSIMECDEMECDMAYIKEHEMYRKSYHYHLDKYRMLKEEFFAKMRKKLVS